MIRKQAKRWLPEIKWADNIPKEGILCHHGNKKLEYIGRIVAVKEDRFVDIYDLSWNQAVPVRPEECYQGDIS